VRRRNFSAFGLTVAMTLTNLFIPKERRKEKGEEEEEEKEEEELFGTERG